MTRAQIEARLRVFRERLSKVREDLRNQSRHSPEQRLAMRAEGNVYATEIIALQAMLEVTE
jgi:hypothetical protein